MRNLSFSQHYSRFLELLDKTSEPLRIQRHQVLDHSNSPVELCSGIETKGILGNDGRPYILDLLRTFPPDLNFQFPETEERREVPKECLIFGYPRRHHHSLASLRPELMEAFVQHRWGRGDVDSNATTKQQDELSWGNEVSHPSRLVFSVAGMNFMSRWCPRISSKQENRIKPWSRILGIQPPLLLIWVNKTSAMKWNDKPVDCVTRKFNHGRETQSEKVPN